VTVAQNPQFEALKSATVMMVDDEETTLSVLEAFLEGEGYSRFVTTTDSNQALELAIEKRPDALLLDLKMPGGPGGFEILEQVRANEVLRQLPVIILTSDTDPQTKLQALELGATDFLGKPVDPSELALRLRNTLAAKAYQDRITYYDSVTGLPNRLRLFEQGDWVLDRARRQGKRAALLHLSLTRFEQIHDTLGERVGNALLRAVGQRLQQCVRSGEIIDSKRSAGALARVGSHEFAVLLAPVGSPESVALFAERLIQHLSKPFTWNRGELFVTSRMGIALYPGDAEDTQTLLHRARMAGDKGGGKSGYRFYQRSHNEESLERLDLENQLRGALKRDELVLHYQPQLETETGRIIGAEALMRWQHPQLGLLPPGRFIPMAEESGLIDSLGAWALRTACSQAQSWIDAGLPEIRMSVNVSNVQFRDGDLLSVVQDALDGSGLDGRLLALEMTEGMIMENPEEATEILARIKGLKVGIAVDDFGTGHSALSYLKTFPLEALKIDQSFVAGLPSETDDAAIVRAIIAMAHNLGLQVVAEGVETPEQLDFLASKGCDEYQGFLFSKPVTDAKFRALLSESVDLD